MTSFTCSLLFIIFTFFSFRLVDPTALKIRITNHALNTLRDEAQTMFVEQVAGATYDFHFLNCKVNVRLTEVKVNQAHLRFVQNYGFQFVIENFGFTVNFDTAINLCIFEVNTSPALIVTGVSATMEVGLIRNENGRLAADMRTCQASADQLGFGGLLPRNVEQRIRQFMAYFISTVFCPAVRKWGLPFVNRKLDTIPMTAQVIPDDGINFDYSLTRDVQVSATSLDMSFKGQAYRQPQPPPVEDNGVELVFRDNDKMVYVGLSQIFFNSAAGCMYEAEYLKKKFNQINSKTTKGILRIKQFFTKPWNLGKPLEAEVGLTEAPTISITQSDGLVFNMRVKVSVISTGKTPSNVFSVSAVCPGKVMINIQGTRLTLASGEVSCKLQTKNEFRKFLANPLNTLLNNKATEFLSGLFGDGVEIPVPPEVNFIQGSIRYENGFVVVGGDLRSTPAGRQRLADWAKEQIRLLISWAQSWIPVNVSGTTVLS